jgi:pyruvate/2-oxoglutarate dehydrogenase complex dihydrolipoamide dehydrogenase (E3) component
LGTAVESLGEHSATLWNDSARWTVEDIDVVVPTRRLLPVTDCSDELFERADAPRIYMIGDCVQPRTALEAMHEAAALAHRL